MKVIDESVWKSLERDIKKEALVARPAFPDDGEMFLCAIDSTGSRHLLVLIEEGEEFEPFVLRGLKAERKDLQLFAGEPKSYIDIQCLDVKGNNIFNLIGGDIGEEILISMSYKVGVTNALFRWRKFWSAIPEKILSIEKQVGLFGELYFLKDWLFETLGPNSLNLWHGPFGAVHDFEINDVLIEVKTTTSDRGKIFEISGIDQLDKAGSQKLFLFALELRENSAKGQSLVQLVQELYKILETSPKYTEKLEMALIQQGYSPAHIGDYSHARYAPIHQSLFEVNESFPKIIRSSFVGGIPTEIKDVKYKIDLNLWTDRSVATNANELKGIIT